MPGPPLVDPKRQQGTEAILRVADRPSGRPIVARLRRATAAGRRGRGGLTFGRFGGSISQVTRCKERAQTDLEGMARKSDRPVAFFTERTLAAYLAVSDRTIRNWIRRGELPSYKLGASRRIDPADVEDFLARHRDEAA